ncbi:nickel-binding protein [Echinicola salinicaeni]|uniref:nickel-binding protein n=1 Tax=Echinicola salinicaeni TaxID=2762757 RepID=UPI0016476131|nr:nickel-binding protein [Echinicola salinicaeni]
MPLFMDFHQFEHITLEDVKNSLIHDETKLKYYGVKFHQFWVNEETASVYCLIEGPDIATCEKANPLHHHQISFSIDEVEAGFFKNMWGVQAFLQDDQIENKKLPDYENRFILSINLWPVPSFDLAHPNNSIPPTSWARRIINEIFAKKECKVLNGYKTENILAQFKDADQAFSGALEIQSRLGQDNLNAIKPICFKMGLHTEQIEKGNYLGPAIQYAQCLSRIANNNQLMVSSSIIDQISSYNNTDPSSIKTISPAEEAFISKVCLTSEQNLSNQNFTISTLCKYIGISRPQLYRKITSITGRSPIIFLRDLRLEKARKLLLQKTENIAQIAMEVGYSSPSYFTKCFFEKFGYKPSYILAH